MTPLHEAALTYARAGIPVFPVEVNGKRPLPYSNGFKDATTDENTINGWWEHADYNLAVEPEQADWAVIDLDGQEGIDAWHSLSQQYSSPETFCVSTPSGGRHLYFSGSLPGSVRKLGPMIDTRGRGSYVLVPPSIVDGVEYRVIDDSDIAELPEWVRERVESTAERKTADGEFELDSPERISEGLHRIRIELKYGGGEPQIGAGSDDRAYRLIARLREIGLADQTITEMLEAQWCPHFDQDWIATKVTNAEKYAQNQRGSVHVRVPGETYASLTQFCAPTVGTGTPVLGPEDVTTHAFARSFEAIRSAEYPVVEWVWQDRLMKGMPNLYTGDAGAGKTTLAENIAVAVACGVGRFLGAEVTPMPVVLIVGEDAEGQVRDNLAAIASGLGVLDHPGMSDIYVRSTLTHEPAEGPWLARIANGEIEWQAFALELAQFIQALDRPSLIVIDPLVEFVAVDTNNDEDASAVGRQFCRMISRFGVGGHTVLVNDHPSKASMASGAHYAGSRHLKSGFALFATLLPGEWSGAATRQRELTLKVIKARYAAETETTFYRTALGPLFVRHGAPGETPIDHMWLVYDYVTQGLGMKPPRYTGKDDRAKKAMPTQELSNATGLSANDVLRALRTAVAEEWLAYEKSEERDVPSHYVLGRKKPSRSEVPAKLAY